MSEMMYVLAAAYDDVETALAEYHALEVAFKHVGTSADFDATVVARLAAAGAVSLGKLNCDEFAMGSSNENSAYHLTRNPWDESRVPGGSSGGSAAAVAARLLPAATGTDTGGSIRQPASFCGITGIKPTYGVCSRYGMIAFASSLDQAGPLARSAEDCALLLGAMSGFDERDATSVQRPPQDFHAQMLAARGGLPWVGAYVSIAAAVSMIGVLCMRETRDTQLM